MALPRMTAKKKALYKSMVNKYLRVELSEELFYNDIQFALLRASYTKMSGAFGPAPVIAQNEMRGQLSHFKKYIETGVRITEEFAKESLKAELIARAILAGTPDKLQTLSLKVPITELGYLILVDEDAVFKLIRKAGPIMLGSPDVQAMILNWLQNKRIANAKMEKLKGALLGYAYGEELPRFKDGRMEHTIANQLHRSGTLKIIYRELVGVLKHFKALMKAKTVKEMADLFSHDALTQFALDTLDRKSPDTLSQDEVHRHVAFVYAVMDYIQAHEDLTEELKQMDWQPNLFAKNIMAKALGMSESKLDKMLYAHRQAQMSHRS